MSIEVKVPDLGDGIDSGDVLNVLVAVGDVVTAEQDIVELETEKAVAPVPSTEAGRVAAVHVQVGETVAIGASLITLDPEAGSSPTQAPEVEQAIQSDADTEQIETATATDQAPAPPDIPEPVAPPTETIPATAEPSVATPVAREPATPIAPTTPMAPTPAAAPIQSAAPGVSGNGDAGHQSAASPAIRRYARELGVDLAVIRGSGPDGRITQEDIRGAVRTTTVSANAAPTSTSSGSHLAAVSGPDGDASEDAYGPTLRSGIPKIRATIGKNMVHSKATAPHVTNFDDADITELEQIRQSSKKDYAAAGIKLTTMPFVVRSVAQALRHHPAINASLDMDVNEIIYKQYVNVGVAVDTERGLVVPVIRGADALGIPQLSREITHFAEKARDGKLSMDDMRGGTFTISNLGAIGGTYSTPVINVPEVAILLIGRSREMPVVKDGEVKIRLMMPLSLSYDHRLVDGATAARFLNDVKGYLETPSRLLIAP